MTAAGGPESVTAEMGRVETPVCVWRVLCLSVT